MAPGLLLQLLRSVALDDHVPARPRLEACGLSTPATAELDIGLRQVGGE